MNINELITGLQPWDKEEYMKMGLSENYIDMVNDANHGYRDYVMSKLNLNQSVKLHGGSINLEFGGGYDNKLPLDKITTLIETFGEEYVMNQLGGGFLSWLKGLFGKRDFDTFKARYDKLRDDLENKILIFEIESKGMKKETLIHADNMRNLLLNRKFKVMMDISLQNEPNMTQQRKTYLEQEISLANIKERKLLDTIQKYKELVYEKNRKTGFFSLFGKGQSLFDKLSKDIEKTAKQFEEVYNYFRELDDKAINYKILKEKYGDLTPEVKKKLKLLPSQIKEFNEWEKSKDQFSKIEQFTEDQLEEAHKLLQKHKELNIVIADYNKAFGDIDPQQVKAQDTLKEWDTKIRQAYIKITQCITIGSKYRNILENAKQHIVDNSNYITTLSVSIVKPIIDEYNKHIKSVDLTSTIMTKLVATLGEIKNDFIKVVPSQNLQTDILFVGSARTYLLSLIENIRNRQKMFSGGEKYIKTIIRKKVGGMYLEQTGYDTYPLYFLHTNNSRIIRELPYVPGNLNTYTEYVGKGANYTIDVNAALGPGSNGVSQEPYGIILYDTPARPQTNLAFEYEKCINSVTTTMIMPILDFDTAEIIIYEISYDDISDIKNLDIKVDSKSTRSAVSKSAKSAFILYGDYIIYNIYADNAEDIGGNPYYEPLLINTNAKRVILPVFKKIRSMNEMIKYDEYHLLNPLTGMPILAIAETDNANKSLHLKFQSQSRVDDMDTDFANGETKYYHFNAIGIKYDIDNTNVNYNAGAAAQPFKLNNAEVKNLTGAIECHWNIIYQLTYIINQLFSACLDPSTTVKTHVRFGDDYKNIKYINDFITPVGINGIGKDKQTTILLDQFEPQTTNLIESFFGGDPRVSVILIRTIINRKLIDSNGELVFYPSVKVPDTTTSLTQDSSKKGKKSEPLSVISQKKDSLTPKQRQVMDYIKRLMPKTSPYWENQNIIMNLVNEFFKPEYKDNFELELAELQTLIYELRKIEQGILKINININNPVELPKYSLITKELEVKPNELKLGETGEVITNAGKELRQLVESRSTFIDQFAKDLDVDIDNLIPQLEDAFFEIVRVSNYNLSSWFNSNPDRQKVYDAISTEQGARKLIDQILSSRYQGSIQKICGALADTVSKVGYAEAAYRLYESKRGTSKPRDEKKKPKEPKYQVIQTKKTHKHHKKPGE